MRLSHALNARFIALSLFILVQAISPQQTFAQEPAATQAAEGGETNADDLVLFESYRDGNWDLYVINADGTNERSLGDRLGLNIMGAQLSPDGQFIALDTDRSISLLDAAGTEVRWVMDKPGLFIEDMTWLPDSRHIGFGYNNDGIGLYVLDIETGELTQVSPHDGTFIFDPLWSPDGAKVAFTLVGESDLNLYVMNTDGSGLRQITDDTDSYMSYTWAPDSETIVFSSNRDGNVHLYRMNLSTEAVDQLTFAGANYDPVWSPDGTQMVFTSTGHEGDASGVPDLYTMKADGTSISRLTNTTSENLNFICPTWTPDSQKIVVLGGVASPDNAYPAPDLRMGRNEYNVFIIDANDGGVTALTMDSNMTTISNCLNMRG